MVDYLAEFNASLQRVVAGDATNGFFQRFYDKFIGANPDVAEKFAKTDMERQNQMLRESMTEMREFFVTHRTNPFLVTLARIHGVRGHRIGDDMYERWLEALVETVREQDPEFNDNVELAWRIVMRPGIEFMKFYRDK